MKEIPIKSAFNPRYFMDALNLFDQSTVVDPYKRSQNTLHHQGSWMMATSCLCNNGNAFIMKENNVTKEYNADSIKILEGLEAVRKTTVHVYRKRGYGRTSSPGVRSGGQQH
jgi:hypothetical protein